MKDFNIKEFIKKNLKTIIILLIIMIMAIIGITLAYNADDIGLSLTAGEYNVVYTGTTTLPTSKLEPIVDSELLSSSNTDKIMKVDFTVKGAQTNPTGKDIIYDVSLTNLSIPTALKSELLKWSLYKNGTQISQGNFSLDFDAQVNSRMVLTEIQQDLPSYSQTADSYTFYIWISEPCTGDITECGPETDTSSLMNKKFSGEIRIELSTGTTKPLVRPEYTGPNAPEVVDGLVPVIHNGTTWVTADETNIGNSWYNYNEKRWANAVLVTDAKRASLTTNPDGTYKAEQIIGDTEAEGVLAFYVWIPRYKYRVWNINKIADSSVYTYDAYTNGINIQFESGTSTTGGITCNYSFGAPVATAGQPNEKCTDKTGEGYYTHPAFTFGSDQLTGFWMGKFEISNIEQDDPSGGEDSIDLAPRTLPNVISWRNNPVDNFWFVINNMQESGNIYGLSTDKTNTDSHMLTNMEWGAVAYLTHSEYGRCENGECTEVAKNNSDTYTTGISGYNDGTYTYEEINGQLASTTGNIYGVYDMSGGAFDYVMGNIGTQSGQNSGIYEYNPIYAGSNYTYTGNEKYVTTYAFGTTLYNQQAYNRGRLGDATSEVLLTESDVGGWYGDNAYFPESSNSWFLRGGYFGNGTKTGVFNFFRLNGASSVFYSARAVLAGFAR